MPFRRLMLAGLGIAALALAGASAFGLWHVVYGGLVRGNARAAEFGVLLAVGAGVLLVALITAVRRAGLLRGR